MNKEQHNEYWADELLAQTGNQQGYFLNLKNALAMVWAAKNPLNDHRQIFKTGLLLMHPDAYRIFFPFSYIGGLIGDIIHPNEYETRADAWYRFWGSSLGEIILLCIFGLVMTGIAVLFLKLTGSV